MFPALSVPEIIQLGVKLNVGVTATQLGLSKHQLFVAKWLFGLLTPRIATIHHGDCVGGDDQLARMAMPYGIRVICHPPEEKKKRAFAPSDEWREVKSYLERNHDIVDETFMLWGFPKGPEELRSGTWATIRYAWQKKKPCLIIYPEGTMEGFFGY